MLFQAALPAALTVLSLASSAVAAPLNTTREYLLKSQVKAGQHKQLDRFNNLYLTGYHSGAGFNDAVLLANKTTAATGFLNATSTKQPNGNPYYNQEFDLGNEYPYSLYVVYENNYSGWEPVQINVGEGEAGFDSAGAYFINSTGLQWASEPGSPLADQLFQEWIACDWWRGVPQLFMRWTTPSDALPSSCAGINLIPEYL